MNRKDNMTPSGNGFIRGIFWALLIGSFGWATAIGALALNGIAKHCDQQKEEFTDIRKEMVSSDVIILNKLSDKMEQMVSAISELRTDVKYLRKERA
jgi:hypothetical protein